MEDGEGAGLCCGYRFGLDAGVGTCRDLGTVVAQDDLLRLTELLLSWRVIAGGLAVGAASTFREEIKSRIKRA